jgi:hypothetical protein
VKPHLIPHLIGLGHTEESAKECLMLTEDQRLTEAAVRIERAVEAQRKFMANTYPKGKRANPSAMATGSGVLSGLEQALKIVRDLQRIKEVTGA